MGGNQMHTKWTDEEVAIVEEMSCLYTVKQIAYRLKKKGYTRSTSAIQNKLRFLGYSTRPILDNYNCCEIARVLQLNSATVWSWVKPVISYQLSVTSLKLRILLITVYCSLFTVKNRIAAIDKEKIEYLVGKLA
uniref:Uncharacterized protein n=1 Tax=Nostoc flagelliforme str. Sunitezuoqi TaxID=676037 RepID=E7DPU7_9NOSO|nr:hypothetical protein Nfla_4504 [Nostoc flagelliforme str. Sunitezuoqi]